MKTVSLILLLFLPVLIFGQNSSVRKGLTNPNNASINLATSITMQRARLMKSTHPASPQQKRSLNSKTPIYYQDFENYVDGDMTFIDNDGLPTWDPTMFGTGSNWVIYDNLGNHEAVSTTSFQNWGAEADDWLITPSVNVPSANDPVYLTWDAISWSSYTPETYEVLISTTGIDLIDFTVLTTISAENESWTPRAINLTQMGFTGQVHIAFHHIGSSSYNLSIDNIKIAEIIQLPDVALNNLETGVYAAYGQEIHAQGSFMNNSSTILHNVNVNWTLNGNGPYTENISNLNLDYLGFADFNVTIPMQVSGNTIQVAGVNNLRIWVSGPNGLLDNNNSNDTLTSQFELSPEYLYFMDFNNYVNGDMTMIKNDNLPPAWDDSTNLNWAINKQNIGNNNQIGILANCWSNGVPGQQDKWMITPPIALSSDPHPFLFYDDLAFMEWIAPTETLELLISNTGNSISDFNTLETVQINSYTTTPHYFDLSAYSGQTVYIAYRYRSDNQAGVGVDNVKIMPFGGLDLGISELTLPEIVAADIPFNVTGVVKTFRVDSVSSFVLNYQVDGGNIINQLYAYPIGIFGDYQFSMTPSATVTNLGLHEVKVWISQVNGITDDNQTNDTLTARVQIPYFTPMHRLVMEEVTGTPCPWCPRGIVYMDSLYNAHPESVIPIVVHGYEIDPMKNIEYNNGFNNYSFPRLFVDRKGDSYFSIDVDQAFIQYDAHISDFSYANLGLQATIDPLTRNLTADILASFSVALQGDYRFAVVLTENNVHGTTSDYDQLNAYAGGANGPMGGFENLPDPIPAAQMYYQYVAREILGGFTGEPNSLPETIDANGWYQFSFSYTVPEEYNIDEMKAIVLLINNQNGQIMNGNYADVGYVGLKETTSDSDNMKLYPNPAQDYIAVELSQLSKGEIIYFCNMQGQIVMQQPVLNVNTEFNISNFSKGIYMVKVESKNGVSHKMFVKQ